MATTSISGTTDYLKDYVNEQRQAKRELDKDSFLQLLVAQLSNQNPLEPTSDTEFIAQLAQFSTLEQMTTLTSTMTSSQAYNLVGKYVYTSMVDEETLVETIYYGRVDGVINENGKPMLVVGEMKFPLESVKSVVQVDDVVSILSNSANLVGKYVKAQWQVPVEDPGEGEDAYETKSAEGLVNRIYVENGILYAEINGCSDKVALGNIVDIKVAPSSDAGAGTGTEG